MTDAEVIDALGGTSKVASATGFKMNTVTNWRNRGISWPARPKIWALAKKRRVKLPDNFLLVQVVS